MLYVTMHSGRLRQMVTPVFFFLAVSTDPLAECDELRSTLPDQTQAQLEV